MKALLVLAIGLLINYSVKAQDTLPAPEKVLATFTEKYPDADSLVNWNQVDDQWKANFKSVGDVMTATFTSKGKWLESTKLVEMREIPEEVVEGVENNHPSAEMESFHKVESKEFNGIAVLVTEGSAKRRYLYKESGEEYTPGK